MELRGIPFAFAAGLALLLGTGAIVWPANSDAQPKVPAAANASPIADYRGLYVGTPYLVDTQKSLPDDIYRLPEVDGVYIRLIWRVIEPQAGRYDWTTLDRELDRAIAAKKKVSVSVISGVFTPDWTEARGVKRTHFRLSRGGLNAICEDATIPWPWDPNYQSAYLDTMRALAAHLKEHPGALDALRIVKITLINRYTEEMRMPISLSPERAARDPCVGNTDYDQMWIQAGYRPNLVLGAWTHVADNVAALFPGKVLAVDVLEGNDFPPIDDTGHIGSRSTLKAQILAIAAKRYAGRFAVQWDGLTASSSSPVMEEARSGGAIIGWSTNAFRGRDGAGCDASRRELILEKRPGSPCDVGGYTAILSNGVRSGGSYIEVWAPDATRFEPALAEIRRELFNGKNSSGP